MSDFPFTLSPLPCNARVIQSKQKSLHIKRNRRNERRSKKTKWIVRKPKRPTGICFFIISIFISIMAFAHFRKPHYPRDSLKSQPLWTKEEAERNCFLPLSNSLLPVFISSLFHVVVTWILFVRNNFSEEFRLAPDSNLPNYLTILCFGGLGDVFPSLSHYIFLLLTYTQFFNSVVFFNFVMLFREMLWEKIVWER